MPGGRSRKTDMRATMNTLFYLLRTGCLWRYPPGDPCPAGSTVYSIFRKSQRAGVWQQICAELHMALREASGREASPTAGIQDRDGAALVLDKIRQRFHWLELVWADGGYSARQVSEAVATQPACASRSSNAPTR